MMLYLPNVEEFLADTSNLFHNLVGYYIRPIASCYPISLQVTDLLI